MILNNVKIIREHNNNVVILVDIFLVNQRDNYVIIFKVQLIQQIVLIEVAIC